MKPFGRKWRYFAAAFLLLTPGAVWVANHRSAGEPSRDFDLIIESAFLSKNELLKQLDYNEITVMGKFVNRGKYPVRSLGYDADSLVGYVEVRPTTETLSGIRCGTGIYPVELPPGTESWIMGCVVLPPDTGHSFRLGTTVETPSRWSNFWLFLAGRMPKGAVEAWCHERAKPQVHEVVTEWRAFAETR